MSRYKQKLLIAAVICATLLVFIIAILPLIVRSKAVDALEEATGRKARIEKVTINPFTLTATIKGFALAAQDGGPFVAIGTLRASLGMASIYKRALIVSQVSVDAPALTFTRLAANNYSFNDIIERQKAKPKKETTSPFLFSLNNISVTNGSIDFQDKAVAGGRNHTVRNLNIAVPFISNIPYLVEKYTDPHISAVVNNAPFEFAGKVKPLSKSMETSVHIDLRQLKLPEYMAYLPVKPPVTLAAGSLTIDSEVTYRISQHKKPELGVTGLLRLDGIAVDLPTGKPLFKLPSLQVKAAGLEVFARRFLFDAITVEGLELFVSRDNRGGWMFSKLLPAPAPAHAQVGAKPPPQMGGDKGGGQPLVQIGAFGLKGGAVHFSDAQPPGGFKSDITNIDLAVNNVSTAADKTAEYELSLAMDNAATLSSDGSFSLTPLSADTSTELAGLKIQRGWPYLAQFLNSPVKGSVDAALDASYTKENGLTVEQASLRATGLSARYGDKEGFDLARLEINDAGFSQKDNRAEIGEIKLTNGTLSLSREVDGSISLLSLLKKPQTGQQQSVATNKTATAGATASRSGGSSKSNPSARELKYLLKKLQIDRFTTSFTDKTVPEKPQFTLKNSSLSLSNLSGPKFRPSSLRFSSTLNKGTPLKVSGTITPQPFRYAGNITVGRLPLRDFEAYFPSNINVFILGGFADTSLNVDIALKDNKPIGSFKGTAGIRGFHAIDTVAEEDLLRWESLQLDGIQGSLEPFNLTLKEIALNGVYSRIIIRKDGTLNLQNLVEKPAPQTTAKPEDKKTSAPPAPPVATPSPAGMASAPQSPAPKKQVRIDAVTIQDGTISFTDNHLPQHFATTFYNLGGRISGLSSDDMKLADVDLRGNLENHSPLQITGQINPLRDDLFVDLKVAFRDIDLSPVTPYSGTYLGYTVEKGKLYLDLKYHIDKKQLDASNNIFIDQFTFGEKVESDKATKLPVKLGLALLKDRKGEIHLDVPVTGRTDDPKFSIWRLVFQVLKNLMVKAVTSPFSLLSSMFGGGQDFSAIQFDHGTSTVPAVEAKKLDALAKALQDRPALKVELKGYVDREKDTEAYRRELLSRKIRNEKFLALAKSGAMKEGQKPDDIQVSSEEIPALLKAVYRKEKFPKPRNILGMLKDLPPDEMRKLIITNTVVGDTELQGLARERVVAVLQHLVTAGKIPAERIFQKNDDIFKAPEKDTVSRSRVELNAIAP